ncbi:HD domain-containing protein [Companilactobacillus halodurans]|uniref:HD domain-containing protein n=1 Tax=Companilactobacillus halodurans TaxID=2584183 RepID=A0A5P0ZX36_9LACO|nr:HD domain-containing protein [Companilactobacillus halodurans]MQS75165.1 HD domain-containing protein [Companilactobacillus halodurans]MQS97570.1 HD domain-containing protein [Companilactobacillus halodurans]
MTHDEQLKAVKDFSYQKMSGDATGHNFDHIQRVVKTAKKILVTEAADPLITLSAAYLHDVADDKLVSDPAELEKEIRDFLKDNQFSNTQIEEIIFITHNLSFSKSLGSNPPKLSLAGQIVQDSDRLDAIGAIGITRAIYYGGANSDTIYDPKILPREKMNKKEYRNLNNETIINHFYEKLLKLTDMMNTSSAKKIAQSRNQYMLGFLAEFKAEWDAKK